MIHDDREEFLKVLERTSAQTGFTTRLLEKDYYITILLSRINDLSKDLVFKGGTCLSKIYYSYYRLSEDIDFTLKLPSDSTTRPVRSNAIKPIKANIKPILNNFGMSIEDLDNTGHNESTQYIFYIGYHSVVLEKKETIKLEIGLRFNPILPSVSKKINHKFLHPFTKEPLFDIGNVNCLALKELVAEKLRAAATRLTIASRDFYDLGYLLNEGFNFSDFELLELFKKKLEEDGFSSDLRKYRANLGRTDMEIKDMKEKIKYELLPVLTIEQQRVFDVHKTIEKLNNIFKEIE